MNIKKGCFVEYFRILQKLRAPTAAYLYGATVKNRIALLGLIVLQTALSMAAIGSVMAMREALDGAALGLEGVFWRGLALMGGLILARMTLAAWIRYLNERVCSSIENNLKGRLLRHLLRRDYASVEATHSGEWMNRMTSDTAIVAGGLTGILPGFSAMAVKLTGAAAMLLVMIPQIIYFVAPAGAAALAATWVLRKRMKGHHKAVQEADGVLRSYLQERLGSMMILRAFRAQETVEREADCRMDLLQAARMRRNRLSNLCSVGFATFMNAIYLLSFAYCGVGILKGTVTYGTLMAVLQLVGQVQAPFANLTGIASRFYAMTASAERLMEVERFPAEETGRPVEVDGFAGVELRGVCFAYPDDPENGVLSHVDLSLRKGDYAALTGHSGSGKSTLFKLLLALYRPVSGMAAVRTKEGEEPLTPAHRPLFAYVPQGNQLMSGTIREVVTFAAGGPEDPERIRRALKIACADTFVDQLERGMDTVLGERGAGLSEGQMQRLAIARAVYADAPVLLLDEATSSLDEVTESQLLRNLRAMTDKTVLIVTHRPAALSICNRIFEVADGALREIEA